MIKEVINYIFSNYPKIDTFVAEVKDNNLPSIKVFEKLEFSEKKVGTRYAEIRGVVQGSWKRLSRQLGRAL